MVAARLRQATREQAAIARLGGDEFVVVVEVEHEDQAAAVAERLLAALIAPVVIEDLEIVSRPASASPWPHPARTPSR